MTDERAAVSATVKNCRICDLTYPAGTEHRCTDGWGETSSPPASPEPTTSTVKNCRICGLWIPEHRCRTYPAGTGGTSSPPVSLELTTEAGKRLLDRLEEFAYETRDELRPVVRAIEVEARAQAIEEEALNCYQHTRGELVAVLARVRERVEGLPKYACEADLPMLLDRAAVLAIIEEEL